MFARRSFVVFCLVLIGVITAPSVVSAVEYGGLGGVPANPDPNNPRTKSIFVYTLDSKQTKQDAVKVVNNTGQAKDVEVYATDSEVASGGSFTCAQKAESSKLVGSWIKVSGGSIHLADGATQNVNFTITMPANPDPGEHDGCIVVQAKGPPVPGGNGVQLSFRSALRVAITVPGDIRKSLIFNSLNVKAGPVKYIVSAGLQNKGNVSLDADINVDVKSCYGAKIYANGGTYPFLAQSQSTELNYEFPRPQWGGWYKAEGSAKYNSDPKKALGEGPKNTKVLAPTRCFFVYPAGGQALIYLLLIILIILIIIWFIWRRKRQKKMSKRWQTFVIDSGDTINSLARDFHTSWKLVAKMNKLKAPYDLKPGSKIKLPVEDKKR